MGVIALFIPGVADRLSDLGQGNEVTTYAQLNSFAWRVYLWETALQWMTPIRYIFGNGLQSFKEYSPIFFPLAGKVNWGAHSVYVQWLFELGAIGILTYIWLYYGALRQLKKMLKIERLGAFFLIVVVLNFLLCAISDNMFEYLSFNWYLWFIVGAGCALVRFNEPAKRVR
jgi:O-antigen ligase